MSYSSTDVANECQLSPLTESSDSFGDNKVFASSLIGHGFEDP